MLSKNEIKYIRSLQSKKFRQKYNIFVVEGVKMTLEIIVQNKLEIEAIYAVDSWIETNKHLFKFHINKLKSIKANELKKISTLKSPNQVLTIVKQPAEKLDSVIVNSDLSLYLDDIRDPGNMGTILRTADWFGIPYVFCSTQCADWRNPKVIQASMGAFLRVKVVTIELGDLKNQFSTLPFYGTHLAGENIFKTSLTNKGIIVIGNEGRGIKESVVPLLDRKLKIPTPKHGGAESLNVGVATGIICALFKNYK